MKRFRTLSIIISVYNEENYIEKVIEKVIKADTSGLKKEIIVVDDGSTDNSKLKVTRSIKLRVILSKVEWMKSEKLKIQKKFPKLKIITIFKKKNEGKGAALKAGFLKSTGDIVLVQDADLEYNPGDYPSLLEPFLSHNADAVYGSRFISDQPHRVLYFWHFVGNFILTSLSNMSTNLNLTDIETGYKVFRGNLIRKIAPRLQSKRFGFEPEITARISKMNNLKIFEVGISYIGRTYKEGKKIGWKDGVRALWEIIKFNIFTPS